MDEIKDPLLEEKITEGQGISSRGYEAHFSSIPKKNLSIVGGYLQIIRRVKGERGKNVPVDEIIKNARVIFINPTLKALDTLWMQHCASSLRGLVEDLQIPEDFLAALKCLPGRIQEDGSEFPTYQRLRDFESFLQDEVHFRDGGKLQKAKDLIDDQTISEIDDIVFERICTDFIQELYDLFSNYCMKNNRPSQ